MVAGLGFGACTERIDIELDSTFKRLIVMGTVSTDSLRHTVQLSRSSDYFANEPSPRVSGAMVELAYENKTLVLKENDTIAGLYLTESAFRGVPGTKYHLSISQVDIDEDGIPETYQASSVMPSAPMLDSISLIYFEAPFVSGYQVLMYADDPATRDWYSFKFWKNQDLLTDTLSKYSVQPDDFFNGSYISGLPVGFYSDDDPREVLNEGDTVTFELNSIEKAFYDFVIDGQLEIIGNIPLFSGPSANVRSNIDNGAKGIFTAYAVKRASLVFSSR